MNLQDEAAPQERSQVQLGNRGKNFLLAWYICALLLVWQTYTMAGNVASKAVGELQSIRSSGLPREIDISDRAYKFIKESQFADDKQAAANELINWVFVKESAPVTTERIQLSDIHPAARTLVVLGDVSVPLLVSKLHPGISEKDAELILSCVNRVLGDKGPIKVTEILDHTSINNVKWAASKVLQRREWKENAAVYFFQEEMRNQQESREVLVLVVYLLTRCW